MQISCEKCSSTYELDARLIPPAGTPVQCTRCGYVFTALPDGTVARRSSTQMFGAVQASTQDPEAPPHARTQMFGQSAQAPKAAAGTKIFGERIPAVEEPPRDKTMAFGKVPATGMDPEPRERTLAFGTLPSTPPQEEEPVREQTLAFGKVPSSLAPAPGRTTQLFGAAAAKPPDGPRATQVFGVPAASGPAPELPPESPRDRTQVFGSAAPQAPAARPAPAPASPPGSTTQIFGSAQVAAAVAKATRQSQAGIPAIQPPQSPGRSTQIFGAVAAQPAAETAAKQGGTQIFGVNEIQAKLAQASAAAASASATLSAEPGTLGNAPLLSMEPGTYGNAPVLAMEPSSRRASARASAEVRLPSEPTTTPGTPGGPTMEEIAPDAGFEDDLRIDFQEPEPRAPSAATAQAGAPRSFGEPAASARRAPSDHVPVNLPPESLPPLNLGLDKTKSRAAAASTVDDELLQMEAGLRNRNRLVMTLLVLVALGGVAFIAFKIVSGRKAVVPHDVLVSMDAAVSLLRRDDSTSQQKALDQLQDVKSRYPKLLEAQADLVLALALRLDDTRLSIKRIELESEILGRRMVKVEDEKSSSDWPNRMNAMAEERQELQKLLVPLQQRAADLERALSQAFMALPRETKELAPRDENALLRAQAVYYGVAGSDDAVGLSERYRAKGLNDGWDAIAYAEYALNARVPADTLAQAYGGLDGVIAQDSSFLRAYVLSARVSLLQKRYDLASNTLEATLALNPAHELAPKLLSWVRQAERAASGQ